VNSLELNKTYPLWVCDECGIEARNLTHLQKYGNEFKQVETRISTYHNGRCDICGRETLITEPRDFGHPDFGLLEIRQNQ
jgi:hypothetical protein